MGKALIILIGITLLFATDLHHLVIAALTDSYTIFKPGELIPSGDVAMLATKTFTLAFKIGVQLSAPFLVAGRFKTGEGLASTTITLSTVLAVASVAFWLNVVDWF